MLSEFDRKSLEIRAEYLERMRERSQFENQEVRAIRNVLAELARLQEAESRIRAVLVYAHDGGDLYSIREILDGNPEPQRHEGGEVTA